MVLWGNAQLLTSSSPVFAAWLSGRWKDNGLITMEMRVRTAERGLAVEVEGVVLWGQRKLARAFYSLCIPFITICQFIN